MCVINKYLGTISGVTIRAFWKDHQREFPALARLARDVLSIPATGAGVERLFNSARDVCHYRRGSLRSETIQELMMYRFTTQFEVEDENLALKKEYLTSGEIEAESEEKNPQLLQDVDPISDNEEEDTETTQEQHTTQGPSYEAPLSDDEATNPLPETQHRISGRNRKRARRDDDQFIEY